MSIILIPTRGRPHAIVRMLEKMPFLVEDAIFGIQNDEVKQYDGLNKVAYITYDNPQGSVGIAREMLRRHAIRQRHEWYICTDDNARFTWESVHALINCAGHWKAYSGKLPFMAGMHSTAPHFDRHLIAATKKTIGGWASYAAPGFIFHAVHHTWYSRYQYPPGCFALEDRHMMFAAIRAGYREFRVCMDAPFSKKRYEPGGQGDLNKRRWNCGRAIEQLAHDFPEYMGVKGTWPTPWKQIFQYADGVVLDRLPGGAMRSTEALVRPGRLKAKRHRRE